MYRALAPVTLRDQTVRHSRSKEMIESYTNRPNMRISEGITRFASRLHTHSHDFDVVFYEAAV